MLRSSRFAIHHSEGFSAKVQNPVGLSSIVLEALVLNYGKFAVPGPPANAKGITPKSKIQALGLDFGLI